MHDKSSGSNESTLRNLRVRQEEIVKEINNDIAEMREDLMQLVNDFTCGLSDKTDKDFSYSSSRLSDVDLQVRRLNETIAVISSFSGIFQQFNSMTSKIFAVETDAAHSPYFETETPDKDGKTTVTPVLKRQYEDADGHSPLSPPRADSHEGTSHHSSEAKDRSETVNAFSVEEVVHSQRTGNKKRNLPDLDATTGAKSSARRC